MKDDSVKFDIKHTARGFEIIEFKDHYGANCSLQQSSLAELEQPGASAVWFGCDKNAPPHMGEEMSPRMHLHRNQVKALVAHLKAWLSTGSFECKKKGKR